MQKNSIRQFVYKLRKAIKNEMQKRFGLKDPQHCWLPDRFYLKKYYKARTGLKLNLRKPERFNEKIQWLKLYDRNPQYTIMADKYRARDYIKEITGGGYIVPLLGVWDDPNDIDFEALPDQFVLKTNHDGGPIICKDRSTFDKAAAIRKLSEKLKDDYWLYGREWCYKDIKRKVICEAYLGTDILDYKLWCFNGEPKLCGCEAGDKAAHSLKIDYYDMEWQLIPIKRRYENIGYSIEKPVNFDKMIEIARKLSYGTKFLRVDLFNFDGKIYCGELTFYPGNGVAEFEPDEWNDKLGSWIRL